jgi:hypothetical protein
MCGAFTTAFRHALSVLKEIIEAYVKCRADERRDA